MEKDVINKDTRIFLIGGSAGSLEVILQLLPQVTAIGNKVIVIVMHRRNTDGNLLEQLLALKSGIPVAEIEDKTLLRTGSIYVAPADYHLLFETDFSFALDVSEKLHFSRPSIDISFQSAASVYKDKVTAVLLSGANADGAEGLKSVAESGGRTLIQDPNSAEVPYMPRIALETLPQATVIQPLDLLDYLQ